jgi:GNAT superfamily N-acetyltransferase
VLRVVDAGERRDLVERAASIGDAAWPEYNKHGDALSDDWPRLADVFPAFQLALYDEETEEVLAAANSIPCRWDGTVDGLPEGIDDVFRAGFAAAGDRSGGAPNTLSALAIVVVPAHQGAGHSGRMIEAMVDAAARHGFADVIVPLRPTWKDRYPLTPIERYARWTRDDGLPFDPWLRTHVRLGGTVLAPAPRSLRITASVADWEGWTGLTFPDDGEYVFPGGLVPVRIDRAADRGCYWEPNIWVRHRVGQA